MNDKDILDLLHKEAERTMDWPEGMQGLFDKGIVSVKYDEDYIPHFSLTKLGCSIFNEIDVGLN